MTIKEQRSMKKVAFGNGFIEWIVLYAIDAGGCVQAMVMGSEYARCLKEIKAAVLEIQNGIPVEL